MVLVSLRPDNSKCCTQKATSQEVLFNSTQSWGLERGELFLRPFVKIFYVYVFFSYTKWVRNCLETEMCRNCWTTVVFTVCCLFPILPQSFPQFTTTTSGDINCGDIVRNDRWPAIVTSGWCLLGLNHLSVHIPWVRELPLLHRTCVYGMHLPAEGSRGSYLPA